MNERETLFSLLNINQAVMDNRRTLLSAIYFASLVQFVIQKLNKIKKFLLIFYLKDVCIPRHRVSIS